MLVCLQGPRLLAVLVCGVRRAGQERASPGSGCRLGLRRAPAPPARAAQPGPGPGLSLPAPGVSAASPRPWALPSPRRPSGVRPRTLGAGASAPARGSRCAFPPQGRPGPAVHPPFLFPDGKCIPLIFADYSEA